MLNKRKKKLTIVIIILMIITSLVILNVIIKKKTLYKNRVNIQNEVENLADNELDNIEDYEEDYEIEEEPLIEQENELQEENVNEIENTANLNENTSKISIKDMHKAIKEVAYSYYMRGEKIQYNSMKGNPSWFAPEEATSQNMNYLVCSSFTKNVYYDLLGIKIPPYTTNLIDYAKDNLGKPEVIAYGSKNNEGNLVMNLYEPTEEKKYITLTNPSTAQIIPYLQIRRCTYIYRTCNYDL